MAWEGVVALVIAPLCEEVTVRWFLFDLVFLQHIKMGGGQALILQALFFVLMDGPGTWVRHGTVFVVGLLLGVVYLKRGLRWSIAVHALINAAVLIFFR